MDVLAWQRARMHVTPFFVFPPDIRRVIYTTNAIESLNMQLRMIIKTLGNFPSDEAETQAAVAGVAQPAEEVGSFDRRLAAGDESVLYSPCRAIHGGQRLSKAARCSNRLAHRNADTPVSPGAGWRQSRLRTPPTRAD